MPNINHLILGCWRGAPGGEIESYTYIIGHFVAIYCLINRLPIFLGYLPFRKLAWISRGLQKCPVGVVVNTLGFRGVPATGNRGSIPCMDKLIFKIPYVFKEQVDKTFKFYIAWIHANEGLQGFQD